MRKFYCIMLAAFFLNAAARAEDKPDFTLECKGAAAGVSIDFKSTSGDAFEDDMSIVLHKNEVALKFPVESGWFHGVTHQSKLTSVCGIKGVPETNYPAFVMNNSLLAVFLVRDGRPSYNTLEVALIDLNTFKFLDFQSIGVMKTDLPVIQAQGDGLKLRIVRESDAAYTDGPDAYAEDWKTVVIKDNKIVSAWLRP